MLARALKPRQPEGRPLKKLRTFKQAFALEFKRQRFLSGKLTFEGLTVYENDPVGFCRDVLVMELWSKQIEMLQAVRDHDRVTIRAGQKLSKTWTAAALMLWWFCTRHEARVVFTAPTWKQCQNVLYRAVKQLIAQIHREHPGLLDQIRVAELCDTGVQSPDFRSINGFVAHDAGSLAGISGQNMLWVLDEASHVDLDIYEAADGNTAAGGSIVAISNALRNHGWWYDSFHKNQEFWHQIHISALDSPNYRERRQVIPGLASYETVERRRRQWGEDSALFQIRVLGNFSMKDEARMYPAHRVQEAIDRWEDTPAEGPLCIGLDPAGASDRADESCAAFVRGKKLIDLQATRSLDAQQLVDWLVTCTQRWRQPGEIPELRMDVEGATGAQVLGTVRAYERQNPGTFKLIPISASDAARRNKKAFATVRDELANDCEQWVKTGALIDDPFLLEELAILEWEVDTKGRNKLLPKSELKSLLGSRSPDRYDALALACYSTGSAAQKAAMQAQAARRQAQQMPVNRGSPDRQWRQQPMTARRWHGK